MREILGKYERDVREMVRSCEGDMSETKGQGMTAKSPWLGSRILGRKGVIATFAVHETTVTPPSSPGSHVSDGDCWIRLAGRRITPVLDNPVPNTDS